MQHVVFFTKGGSAFSEKFRKFSATEEVAMSNFIREKVLAGYECSLYTHKTAYKLKQDIQEVA